MESLSDTDVANIAIKAARSKNCVLCIANTVARAQSWYEHILAEMRENEFDTGLLHSKFPGFRRTQIEDHWMESLGKSGVRPHGCILVATQVVEQSVDIDADYLITELAPTDMILQRIGRQWRHNRHHRPSRMPETVIVSEDISDSENLDDLYTAIGRSNCKVYSPWVLWKTWSVWKDRHTLTLPDDIRTLLEQTYLPPSPDTPDIAGLLYDEFLQMKNALSGKARGMLSAVSLMPTGQDRERCATRYSDLPTVQAVLVKDILNNTAHAAQLVLASEERVDVNKYTFDFGAAQALHTHLISVPVYLAARYGEIITPPYLQKYFYENTPVMEWDDISGEIKMNGRPTDFQYSHSKGLFRQLTGRNTPPVASSYQSDWEDIDIFDKARFDW
jgi:CRISPR-associated endonuclease/helicase Cas3